MRQIFSKRLRVILWTLGFFFLIGTLAHHYFPRYFGLVLLFFYIIPSNSFIPFPHEPAIIFYGKIYGPYLTTLAATLPTIIACYLDYEVLTPVFNLTRVGKIRDTKIYLKTYHYFKKAPFLTNAIAAVSPVPFYPIRILSIAGGYPAWKYTASVVLGRIPRYFLLAYFGALINIPNWIIGLFFVTLLLPIIYKKLQGKKARPEIAPEFVAGKQAGYASEIVIDD